jgi:AAA15 family ATPase/GTPase
MITRLTLRNFKSVGEQVYDFTQFDLLVGRNNSGKSTVLQALAIWQFCVDAFHRSKRSGSKGIQVVLPNFTALPVPEFNLLWKDRDIRHSPDKKQEYILIAIHVQGSVQTAKPERLVWICAITHHKPFTPFLAVAGRSFAPVNRGVICP